MKVVLIGVLIVLAGFVLSCSDLMQEDMTPLEASLKLTAPNGEKIASNIKSLKEKGGVSGLEIVSIEYMDINDGYVAIVNCLNRDNHTSNFALVKGDKYIDGLNVKLLTKSFSESGSEGSVVIKCVADDVNCTSCSVVVDLHAHKIYCSCDKNIAGKTGGCTLTQTKK